MKEMKEGNNKKAGRRQIRKEKKNMKLKNKKIKVILYVFK